MGWDATFTQALEVAHWVKYGESVRYDADLLSSRDVTAAGSNILQSSLCRGGIQGSADDEKVLIIPG